MSQPVPIAILSAVQTTASQPGQSLLPDSTALFTTANFVLIAVLAVLVVIGLIYGTRLHRRRREARGELKDHNEALLAEGVADAPVAPDGEPVAFAAPPAPPSVERPGTAEPRSAAPLPFRGGAGGGASPQATTPADKPYPTPSPEPRASESLPDRLEDDSPMAAEAVAPAISPAPAPPSPTGPPPADGPVTQLKGLGPRVAERLAAEGITTVGQLAALTDDEAQILDAHLGPFTGRMTRDRWLEQARFLAAGDRAGFESVFGRL